MGNPAGPRMDSKVLLLDTYYHHTWHSTLRILVHPPRFQLWFSLALFQQKRFQNLVRFGNGLKITRSLNFLRITPSIDRSKMISVEEEEALVEIEAVQAVYGSDCHVIQKFPPHINVDMKPRTADDSSQQVIFFFFLSNSLCPVILFLLFLGCRLIF